MSIATDESLFYLVVDVQDGQPIYVFLGRDPAGDGPHGEPVQLELLPPMARFGRPGRPTSGRPVLGKARGGMHSFREFATSEDLWEAGFLPVPSYRVCDDWNDYHMPWSGASASDRTAAVSFDDSV
jgi:hypothetical protein